MAIQRKTRNLGLNRSKDKEKIYQHIENVLKIKEKLCARGTSEKDSKYGVIHEGGNPLPIRNFNLQYAYINNGKIILKGDGLQVYCISCERKYRKGRLDKWKGKYSKMKVKDIYEEYKTNYRPLKVCSMCKEDKKPEEFSISRGMDTGLHNTCKKCAKAYTEAVGGRWEIVSPDGHHVLKITEKDSCQICGSKIKLHKDHIWPISKGGTDHKENIQVLCGPHNLSKSATIIGLTSIHEIDEKMICERYHHILEKAKIEEWALNKFESEICREVKEFISWKKGLTNEQLKDFFEKEKERNNRKHSVEHSIKKFRKYCGIAILEINKYIEENK